MQQFPVPKYINLEAHILGPLSLSQTVTVIIGGAIVMILYLLLETFLFILGSFTVLAAVMIISFGKINGRPMADYLADMFSYNLSSHVYVWATADKTAPKDDVTQQKTRAQVKPQGKVTPASTVTPEQIRALAQQLDMLEK